MGYFEDLGKRLSTASKGAVKKASAFADSAAVTVRITALSRERDHIFREIGAAYFSSFGTAPAPELTDLCCAAATKTAEIESLRLRQQQIRNKCVCPSCGTLCSLQDQFCASCGAPIAPIEKADLLHEAEALVEESPFEEE